MAQITLTVDSDTILYYKLFRFSPPLVFSTAQHFQSVIKMKIDCKGD